MHPFDHAVAALLRDTAAAIVMPRFRNLAAGEIAEKSPGDFVTIADRESEERLTAGLAAIDPQARIVGEEACAADSTLLDDIDRGRVWLVDPIDGTGNYAAGRTPFGLMVALVEDGETCAGWMLDPVAGRLCHAVTGGGAWVDGRRIRTQPSGAPEPIAALATYFMDAPERTALETRAAGRLTLADIPRCAAEQYPRVVLGVNDLALFQRTLPWDHAAGTLFVAEAGGRVARADGSAYRVSDNRRGLLAAATPALWDMAAPIIFG